MGRIFSLIEERWLQERPLPRQPKPETLTNLSSKQGLRDEILHYLHKGVHTSCVLVLCAPGRHVEEPVCR